MSVGTLTRGARGPAPPRLAAVRPLGVEGAVVAALTVVAAVLRFAFIAHQGFWFDEANTSQLVSFSPGPMLTLIKHYESTPPLYYCVAWVWARIFGFGEGGLRSLSAFCGVLAVPVAYGAAAKLISRRAGVIAAALTTFSPLLIWYSQEARAYELVVLLTGLSLLTFAYALANPRGSTLAAWAVACALALATEYYAALVIVPEALWLVHTHRRDPGFRRVVTAVAVLVLWSIPLLWLAISQNGTGHASWIAPLPLSPRLGQIVPQFSSGFQLPAQQVLMRLAEGAALVGLVLLAVRSDRAERRGALIALSIAVAGFVLNLLVIAGGIDDLLTRNVISLWMPAAVAVAGGLAARRARTLGAVCTVVLCAVGLTGAVAVAANRNYQRPDWRAVARVLGARPAPGVGARAILIQRYRDVLPLSLYLPGLESWPHTGTNKFSKYAGTNSVGEFDVITIAAPRVYLCWWGAACNLAPTRLQSAYRIPGFHVAWIRHAYQFTIMRMVAARPVPLPPDAVSSALTETRLEHDDLLLQR
ncbi:MAG: glycosyltransferase family 39 protein [Solirubrobacterales bacterium]|nr:glycosyltransferase family 39 protein [Solirubrobacterales bacterium]MBV9167356.1 glycosyltransferase family 39 protein [Solirubrobacterales bacterium]